MSAPLTSVAGGVLGYFIGAVLYDSVGLWLIQLYGYGDKVDAFRAAYAQWGAWIILLKGLTPIPYKIVTIASGFAGYSFPMFVAAVVHRPRHALLSAGFSAQPLRPPGAGHHRGAAWVLGDARRRRSSSSASWLRYTCSELPSGSRPQFCHRVPAKPMWVVTPSGQGPGRWTVLIESLFGLTAMRSPVG